MEKLVYNDPLTRAWVEDYEWVGIVYPQDVKPNVTLIMPLAFYNEDRVWQTISEDERDQEFPNNSRVAYFTSDFPEQKVNQLYQFWPESNQQSSVSRDAPIYSYYFTRDNPTMTSEPLAQVFNWSSRASHIFAIPDLLNEGIPTSDCLSHSIFIQYQNQIYGPIRLEADLHNTSILKPHEYSQTSTADGLLLLLKGYAFPKDKVVFLEGKLFIDQKTLDLAVSQVDWSLPHVTIKRSLRASRDVSKKLQNKELLVEREINELAALSKFSGPEALRIEHCIIQRAQYIVQHQIENLDGVQTLIEELPEEHPLLEKARTLEIQRRKGKIEQECEAEQRRLQALQAEIMSAQDSLTHLKGEIAGAQQKQKQMNANLATLETSLPKRLAELRQEMLNLLTELQFTSTLPLALSQPDVGETTAEACQSVAASAVHRQNYFLTDTTTTLINPRDLPWKDIARQHGVNVRLTRVCTATLLAGLIPVANSPMTLSLLHAVVQGIAGRRIWHVPVPLTATSPLDIFGHILVDQRSFLPAAGALADILIEAQAHPEQLGLIVLEGIDRVPFLPVIEPLLRQYRAVRQHVQHTGQAAPGQETLQLFHPRALALEDPYQRLSSLVWPANLLLAVTCDENVGCFPLLETHASWFAHIEHLEIGNDTYHRVSDEQKNWQVSPTSWCAWEKEIVDQANDQGLFLPEWWQQVFFAAMELFGMRKELQDIIEQLWPEQ